MDLKIKKFFTRVLSIILCVCFVVFSTSITYCDELLDQNELMKQLKIQIKKELRAEFKSEIEQVIRDQVQMEIAVYMAGIQGADSLQPQIGLSSRSVDELSKKVIDHSAEFNQEDIGQIVNKIVVQEMEKLSDQSLDRYIAAGGVSDEVNYKGLSKNYKEADYQLASAKDVEPGISKNTIENDSEDVTGGEAETINSVERTLQQKGSILLPKGTMQVEPSISWAHFSSNRISVDGLIILDVFTVGEIATETISRDIYVENIALKYGLYNNFQVDVKIPFRGEYDRITDTNSSETTNHTSGMGDIDIGLSRQIGWEEGWRPDLIAAVGVKTTSGRDPYNKEIGLGTGHWAVRTSLIAAKTSDPAVVFGSLTYTYNFSRDDIEGLGEVDPGDTVGYSLGTAIALSYQTAINFSFDHSLTFKTKSNGSEINGTFLNIANFRAGLNWAISERASVDFGVSMGLTKDSPDVTVELRFPITF